MTSYKEGLESELAAKSATFREIKEQITVEQLLSALPNDAALIDFWLISPPRPDFSSRAKWRSERKYVAFIVRNDREVQLLDLGSAEAIIASIANWRQTFGQGEKGKAAGRDLRARLWQPLEKHLDGAQTILISTNSGLGNLPFSALPGKNPGTYLLEEYRLAYLPVPQLLPKIFEQSTERVDGEILLMGGIDYGAEPIESTRVEETTLAQLPSSRGSTARVLDRVRGGIG